MTVQPHILRRYVIERANGRTPRLSAALCAFGTTGMFPTGKTTDAGLFWMRSAHRFESFTSDAVFGS
ncbi:hypothetical protein ACMYR2_0313 [Nitrobacter sp. TKz-YC01]